MTLLLTLVAGYCDTVTFVSANELFSAHVTGNFIVFAYDVVHGVTTDSWARLLSFPVFVAAVAVARWVTRRQKNRYTLLLIESILLIISGVIIVLSRYAGRDLAEWVAMSVVFAMGLQNAFSRLYPKETFAPTTVMTGNVTQLTLDISDVWLSRNPTNPPASTIPNQLLTVGSFLAGCLTGGIAASQFGLATVALPGLLLLIFSRIHYASGEVQPG